MQQRIKEILEESESGDEAEYPSAYGFDFDSDSDSVYLPASNLTSLNFLNDILINREQLEN